MNNFDPIKVNILGMAPKHGQNQVKIQRNGFINISKVEIQKVLKKQTLSNIRSDPVKLPLNSKA